MQFVLFLAKYFRCHTVDLLEYLVEIGDGAKAHIVTDGRNGVVCMLQLESCLLQADLIQVLGHGITGVLPELSAQIGLAEMEGLQDFVKAGLQKFVHMKTTQQLTEPNGIICVIVADLFLNKKIQKGNTQRPKGCHFELGFDVIGQYGMRDPVFVILHLLQGHGDDFGEHIAVIRNIKVFSHKRADRFKELRGDNDIPVFAVISFFPVKVVNVGLIQKYDVSGVQGMGFPVEGVGNGTLQNIENFIESVRVNDLIAVLCNFGVKWLRRCRHPIVKHDEIHQKHPPKT